MQTLMHSLAGDTSRKRDIVTVFSVSPFFTTLKASISPASSFIVVTIGSKVTPKSTRWEVCK